ncbi:MAG TPA: ABC transporter ATP-binding protein [Candidatus Dormibacteraeota bacterium]|jgi:putative ABC transport system ATP-binding protein|nr:ABC transporter ATP-binding protein [Candidatus Dormibacteraeota bacterium]
MYELSKVGKRFSSKVIALRDVDLSIGAGEFLAVQGSTGGGKTTLLQLLGALDRPTSGTLTFDGRDLGRLREGQLTRLRGSSFGFIFQTFNLLPTLTALENVETALVPLRVRGSERRERSLQALVEVGLEERINHLPSELSGGQQQRVAIARALVKYPRVILADEPTGNLDEDTRDEIIDLLETLWRDRGLTCILVTHDSAIARRAQRTVWISHGRLSARRERRRRGSKPAPTDDAEVPREQELEQELEQERTSGD